MATSHVKPATANDGNSGAVLIRFGFEDTSFVFLNCQLCPGIGKSVALNRHQQLAQIVRQGYKGERGTQYQSYEIFNHNVRVFFGDLNFRVALNKGQIGQLIEAKEYRKMMGKDELYLYGM